MLLKSHERGISGTDPRVPVSCPSAPASPLGGGRPLPGLWGDETTGSSFCQVYNVIRQCLAALLKVRQRLEVFPSCKPRLDGEEPHNRKFGVHQSGGECGNS